MTGRGAMLGLKKKNQPQHKCEQPVGSMGWGGGF